MLVDKIHLEIQTGRTRLGRPGQGTRRGSPINFNRDQIGAGMRYPDEGQKITGNRALTSRECIPDSTPTLDNNIPAPIRRFRCSPTWHPLCCITPSPIHRKARIPMGDAIKVQEGNAGTGKRSGGACESEAVLQAEVQGKAHMWSHS